jgi:hypothetical protein
MSDDELRQLAEAGVKVLGTDEQVLSLFEHHCRNGTWLFVGASASALIIGLTSIEPWWTIGGALFIGWAINEREARKIKAHIRSREQTRST